MKFVSFLTLLIFLTSCGSQVKCEKFKEGSFKHTEKDLRHIRIERYENEQIETDLKTGTKVYMTVDWVSECSYILTYKKVEDSPLDLNYIIGTKVYVDIIECDISGYKCHFKSDFEEGEVEFNLCR